MRARVLVRATVLAIAVAGLVAAARADTITLVNGRVVQGKAVEANGVVTIDHGSGRISLPRSLVAKIEADGTAPLTTLTPPAPVTTYVSPTPAPRTTRRTTRGSKRIVVR